MPMTAAQRHEGVARRRQILLLAMEAEAAGLTPKCRECGLSNGEVHPDGRGRLAGKPVSLQLDHLRPRTWGCRTSAQWVRINNYEREFLDGDLQTLCDWCNASKGEPVDPNARPCTGGESGFEEAADEVPF